ncbi:uncharacterized protein TNCV_3242581 [Trichonephila clavipes]|nr:uncharacterized protein TNCV_3242581 [Trichonephila clavipes]
MDWPGFSPDLNPVEHVWDMLGRRVVARQLPPTYLPQLWRTLLVMSGIIFTKIKPIILYSACQGVRLETCQNQISEQLLDTEDAVQEYLDDMEDAENYRDRYIEMCTRVDLKIRETVVPTETEKRSFKLPKIELKKFSGEAKDFLAFWSQFQKIHNDKGIAEEDKMQYLLQSVKPKSKPERLVLSFPATAENYPKAIDQLKERFGREDLLVQIYVREL